MKNYNVEGLRGLLMIWIILFHYTTRYSGLYNETVPVSFNNGGKVGVAMFFVISGYFLSHSLLESSYGLKNVTKFVVNKYWRLYPAYLISVVLIYTVTSFFCVGEDAIRTVDVKTFLINCLFVYHPKVEFVDGAHWFIASLVKMQIALGFLLLFKKNRRHIILLLTIIILIAVAINMYFPNTQFVKLDSIIKFIDFAELFLGIALYISLRFKDWIFCALAFLLCLYVATSTHILLFMVYIILFIILILPQNRIKKYIINTHFFDNHVILYLGRISFTWYLIHQNIGYTIINSCNGNYILGVILAFVVTFGMAVGINILVEKIPKRIV